MTNILNGRSFSTCECPNTALNKLMEAMATAIHQSYPERFK